MKIYFEDIHRYFTSEINGLHGWFYGVPYTIIRQSEK